MARRLGQNRGPLAAGERSIGLDCHGSHARAGDDPRQEDVRLAVNGDRRAGCSPCGDDFDRIVGLERMREVVLLAYNGGVFCVVGRLPHPAATCRPTAVCGREVFVAAVVRDVARENRVAQVRPPRRVLVVLSGQRHLRRRAYEAVGVVQGALRRVGSHILDERRVFDDFDERVVDQRVVHRVEVAHGVAQLAGPGRHLAVADECLRFEQRLAIAVDGRGRGGKLLVLREVVVVVAQ